MSGTLSKAWWLLALCGILDAVHAIVNLSLLMTLRTPVIFRGFGSPSDAVWEMGWLALSAGACAIVAGLWSAGKDRSWLLSLHGLALAAFGAICVSPLVKGPLSFRPVSLLFVVMAASVGVFALEPARAQRSTRETWFPVAVGALSIAFAISFILVGFLKIVSRLEPAIFFSWMSSYFVLCAIFMLWLALRAHRRDVGQSAHMGPFPSTPVPTHMH